MPRLKVHVIEARGMAECTSGRYYVKLGWPMTPGASRAKTTSMSKSSDWLKWNQDFCLHFSNLDRGLLLRLYNKHSLHNDVCIANGLVEHLSDLVRNQSTLVWCPLQGPYGDPVILLELRAVDFGCASTSQQRSSYFRRPISPVTQSAPLQPSIAIPFTPLNCVVAEMPGPSNAVDEGPEDSMQRVASTGVSRQGSCAQFRTLASVSAMTIADVPTRPATHQLQPAETAIVLPHVSRSIADQVCAYKEQVGAIRSAQRKKKFVKYGKRAAVLTGVVAVGVIGGFAGAAIF